jgi:hypothetical protein
MVDDLWLLTRLAEVKILKFLVIFLDICFIILLTVCTKNKIKNFGTRGLYHEKIKNKKFWYAAYQKTYQILIRVDFFDFVPKNVPTMSQH